MPPFTCGIKMCIFELRGKDIDLTLTTFTTKSKFLTMEPATTPTPTPARSDSVPPSTPNASATSSSTMRVQRNTPAPSTPGGHRIYISSTPRTPGTSALICSPSSTSFTRVTVHTAKCSECDLRNKGTMLRCPGCTFQICKPCQDGREMAGKSLAHGNMLSPQVATPGTGGSVVRRKPVATARSVDRRREREKEREKEFQARTCEVGFRGETAKEEGQLEAKRKKRVQKPASKPKPKSKLQIGEVTPSDDSSDDASDDSFISDPASPTSNKRRRKELAFKTDCTSELPSPFLNPADRAENSTTLNLASSVSDEKAHVDMSTDELLAYHGVNTPENPYKAHLLSRDVPVLSNPVIGIPEVVRRGFKPRPSAEEIQKNIQEKVREKLGLSKSTAGPDASV